MASPSDNGGSGLGLALMGGKMVLRIAISSVITNQTIIEYIASSMHRDESGGDGWKKLQLMERAVWMERARSSLRALMDTVSR